MDDCFLVLYIVTAVLFCFTLLVSGVLIMLWCGRIDIQMKKRKNYRKFGEDVENCTVESLETLSAQLKVENEEKEDALTRIETLSAQLKVKKEETKDALKRIETLNAQLKVEKEEKKDALKRFQKQADDLEEERSRLSILSADLKIEREEKEDALKRLSAIMSSRLRDGNPNVVDLSDQNRPLKIGEQFSELYDNQWTDAYGAVETFCDQTMQESDIILMLLYILEHCFMHCKGKADQQLFRMKENVSNIAHQITKNTSKLPEDLMQRIKEERKLFAKDELPGFDEVLPQLKEHVSQRNKQSDFPDSPALRIYVNECLKLCWLMVVQDPPMTMLLQPVGNANDEFKPYKNRGSHVAFIVWPALLLEERGALLSKGVAEFQIPHDPEVVHL